MNEKQFQIKEDDKCYILMTAGGMGARIIQTVFVRSLIKKRSQENNSYPIIVMDNSLIGHMVSESLKDQNVYGIQAADSPHHWPNDPGLRTLPNGIVEHPMFTDWRENFKLYSSGAGNLRNLIHNNLNRTYQIEYGFNLNSLIHERKLINDSKSHIGHLYSKSMREDHRLEYDGGVPMLKRTDSNEELTTYIDQLDKPFVLLQLGVDRNSNEFMSPINYRLHKVWSLQRWAEVAAAYPQYEFIQVYANNYNPELPNIKSIKVDNLNPVLQLLESNKCKFFMSTDNYLPHLAASLKKKGIVLWGSVSPYVWGWKHNINIWNTHSCKDIACWRPGLMDTTGDGLTFVCDHYSCMRSISTKQVLREIEKLEEILEKDKNKDRIVL